MKIIIKQDGAYHYDDEGKLVKIVVGISSTLKGKGGVK